MQSNIKQDSLCLSMQKQILLKKNTLRIKHQHMEPSHAERFQQTWCNRGQVLNSVSTDILCG